MNTLGLRSVEQRAEEAGIHPETLRKLIKLGTGPKVTMIGHVFRIRDDHWREWLDHCAATPEPPPPAQRSASK